MAEIGRVNVTIGEPELSCPKTVKIQITLQTVSGGPIKPMRPVVTLTLNGGVSRGFDFTDYAASDDSPLASGVITVFEGYSLGDFHVNVSTVNNFQAGSADGTLSLLSPLLNLDVSLVPGSGDAGNAAKVSGTVRALCPANCSVFVGGFWYGPDNLAQIHSLGGRTYSPTLDPLWGFGGFEGRWYFPSNALGFSAVAQATDQYGQAGNTEEKMLSTA
jgi:hypothetical protein